MNTCEGCKHSFDDHHIETGICLGCYNWANDDDHRNKYKPKHPVAYNSPEPSKYLGHPEGFIIDISSEDTGGGCIVDFVHLRDGRILGITDECICLYKSMEHFGDGDDLTENEIINLI